MKYVLVCILLCFKVIDSNAFIFQSPTQNVKGIVFDQQSRISLPGATIVILNSDSLFGTVTNIEGRFEISLPVGRYDLKVDFTGYETKMISNVLISSGKERSLEIGLLEDVIALQEVVVSPYENNVVSTNEMAVISARSISPEETQRYAGSLNDPSRAALSYAGVNNGNGDNNEIIIRGNSPRGLLWRLEGVEIPNPNHFAQEGSSGGLIGILNSNNLSRSDFFISAFPIEYGNAYSGIFDLKLRNGNVDKREHTLEASLVGLSISTEGPLNSSGGSYIGHYRYSTLGLLKKIGVFFQAPEYQDITFKVTSQESKAGSFSLFGLGGAGESLEQSFFRQIDSTRQTQGPGGRIIYGFDELGAESLKRYDLGVLGIAHFIRINNKSFLENVVSISATRNRPSEKDVDKTNFRIFLSEKGEYLNSSLRLSSTLNHKISARNQLKIGFILSRLNFNLKLDKGTPDGSIFTELHKQGNSEMYQGFVGWLHRPNELWSISGGVHIITFPLSGQTLLEPRFSAKRKFNSSQSINLGFGLHSRHENIATYFGENPAGNRLNEDLKLSRSAHLVLGYFKSFSRALHFNTEIYFQYLYDIPVENSIGSSYSSVNEDVSFTTFDLVNSGIGYNYGVELTLERNFSRLYYFLLTGSVFESKYKALDGEWRNTRYNINFATNVIGGKEFKVGKSEKHKSLGVNIRLSSTGGKRIIPISLQESISNGFEVRNELEAYNDQLPPYFRMDFSLYLRREKKRSTHEIKLDILSLFEKNILENEFVPDRISRNGELIPAHIREVSYADGESNLLPILSYKVSF